MAGGFLANTWHLRCSWKMRKSEYRNDAIYHVFCYLYVCGSWILLVSQRLACLLPGAEWSNDYVFW